METSPTQPVRGDPRSWALIPQPVSPARPVGGVSPPDGWVWPAELELPSSPPELQGVRGAWVLVGLGGRPILTGSVRARHAGSPRAHTRPGRT